MRLRLGRHGYEESQKENLDICKRKMIGSSICMISSRFARNLKSLSSLVKLVLKTLFYKLLCILVRAGFCEVVWTKVMKMMPHLANGSP